MQRAEGHTRAGSVLTSFLPPAMRVEMVLMSASPAAEVRSSKIGMSIVCIPRKSAWRMNIVEEDGSSPRAL